MAVNLKYYWDEARYHTHKTTRMLQGKALHVAMRTAMGGGAASVASDLAFPVRDAIGVAQPVAAAGVSSAATMSEMAMASAGGLVSIGLGAGVNVYLNHLEHKHNERQLCELYRPQVASITGKEPVEVGIADLKEVATTNPSLHNELKRNDRSSTVMNVAAIAGTALAFGAVFAAVTLVPPLAGLAVAASAGGFLSGAGLTFAAVAGGLGYASLHVARKSLTGIGNKIFGLDKPSVEDKISVLSKQHRKEQSIVPEQVMDVFVAAQPELATEIKNQYGADYSALTIGDKRKATAQYAESLQTPQIAAAINAGQMNVRELTFRVHGQFSGVYPEDPWQEKMKDYAQDKLDPLQEKITHLRDDVVDRFQQWRTTREQSKLQDDVAKAIEEGRPLSDKAQEVGNETYWRNLIAREREAAKSGQEMARS